MSAAFFKSGAIGALLLGLGTGGAFAAVGGPKSAEALGIAAGATPVAMCGYSCRSGGRYVPGPPDVCEEQGLRYCGSSRGGFGGGRDRGDYGGGRDRGDYGGRGGRYGGDSGGGCHTVTIERDDGTVSRVRRCD